MPIFMDRHEVSESVTAQNVAHLHQEDLKIQHQFGCRGLTYWFDDHRKTAFCLIEAVGKNAIIEMHGKAHGQVPNEIIEVDPNIVESFLGRITDPQKAKTSDLNVINESAFRTIMVAHLEGLPNAACDPTRASSIMMRIRPKILDVLRASEGNIVEVSENGFIVVFASVTNAIRAAVQVDTQLKADSEAGKHLHFKLALNAGDPVTKKKTLFEETTTLAKRICKAVKGDIVLSSVVKELFDSANLLGEPITKNIGMVCLSQEDETFLNFLMDFIESNWDKARVKVEDLNKSAGYSKSQFYRKIVALTG